MCSQQIWQSGAAATPCAADHCWLEDVQLMAVQPACIIGVPEGLAVPQLHLQPHMQQVQQPGHLPGGQYGPAAGQREELCAQEASLLLHLQAVFCDKYNAPGTLHTAALPGSIKASSPLLPLQLTKSGLQLLVLSPDMQVLHHLQHDLLDLVLQQQGQASGEQPMVVSEGRLQPPTATVRHDCRQEQCQTDISEQWTGAEAQTVMKTDDSGFVQQQAADAQGCSVADSSGEGTRWTMPLYLQVRFPAQSLGQSMYALRLVLAVKAAAPQQQQPTSKAEIDSGSAVPGMQAVAEVPLLVLPRVAQQEVQQLLLPAMRQEVQAEQQQQPIQQLATAEEVAQQALYVEHVVWTHFCSLANDICLALQLSQEYQRQPAVMTTAETAVPPPADMSVDTPKAAEAPLTVAMVPCPSAALEQVASAVLFPLLLPFLATHGLHNLLQLLVSCLPGPLQEQWQQQQAMRLVGLQRTAPQAQTWAAVAAADDLQATSLATIQEGQEEQDDPASEKVLHSKQPMLDVTAGTPSSGGLRQRQTQQQQKPGSPATAAADSEDKVLIPTSAASTKALSGAGVPSAAEDAAIGAVPWYAPFTQFAPQVESRYIAWKQQRLAFVDYFATLFGLMYLAVLLKRCLSEPTTLFYCLVISIKTLPHVPLIIGCTNFFNRYREPLLFMVAPLSLITFFWFVLIQRIGDPEALLPQKTIAAFWSSHGELATSAIRPFTHHMRLRPYIVYCLLDAAIMVWVFGKVYGMWAAAVRWGFACMLSVGLSWGLDFHMRRGFPARQISC